MDQPEFGEQLIIFAHRADDFADRRYEVTVTVTVPADSVGEAIGSVIGGLQYIGVA